MVNTRLFEGGMVPMFFQANVKKVFYSEVPGKANWSFVVRHNPRGRPVKYNLEKGNEEGLEEEDDDEYHDQHELDDHVPEEDVKELFESNDVSNNAHEDYINDDMIIVTEFDDDDDMANTYNVDFGSDDTDDDLDEEDDEVY